MRNRILTVAIAAYVISNPQPLFAQEPQLTIRVLATVDYPGSGNSTTVQGINDLGDVTGYFEDSTGAVRSFVRYPDGTFSDPIVEPNDVGNVTVAKDIDNTGRICGYYLGSDPYTPYRGFFLADSIFTEYGAGVLTNWYINGITDVGGFCGTLDFPPNLTECFLLTSDSNVSWIINSYSECNAINSHGGSVGDYIGGEGYHGFIRDTTLPFGRLLLPIDYPGASDTFFYGLNDGGRIIVGKYADSIGATHGLILQRPDTWSSYDYPGAVETSLNGISNNKLVSGYYVDSSGIHHGFIGKVHQAP